VTCFDKSRALDLAEPVVHIEENAKSLPWPWRFLQTFVGRPDVVLAAVTLVAFLIGSGRPEWIMYLALTAIFLFLRLGTLRPMNEIASNVDAVYNHNETDERIFEVATIVLRFVLAF
jgi:ABC-type multidrug transport system fused ATPase/permease subunit